MAPPQFKEKSCSHDMRKDVQDFTISHSSGCSHSSECSHSSHSLQTSHSSDENPNLLNSKFDIIESNPFFKIPNLYKVRSCSSCSRCDGGGCSRCC